MSEPRLEPADDASLDDETRAALDALGRLNIFTTLAHHPKLLKRWMVFGNHILNKSTLPEREREIAILRVGHRCRCEYEFGQHIVIGRRVGITDEEIGRLTVDEVAGWGPLDAALVTAADELVADHVLSDATWAALGEHWTTQQVLDLIFTIGQYTLVCMALNSLGVQLDDDVPGWPT